MSSLTRDEIDLINAVAQNPAEAMDLMRLLEESKKRNGTLKTPEQKD